MTVGFLKSECWKSVMVATFVRKKITNAFVGEIKMRRTKRRKRRRKRRKVNEKRKRTPSRKESQERDTEEILYKQISELVKPCAPTRA